MEGMSADDRRSDADLLHTIKSCLQNVTPPCVGRPNHKVYGGEGASDLRVVKSDDNNDSGSGGHSSEIPFEVL